MSDNDNIIDSQNTLYSIKELLQELYVNLVNTDVEEYYNFEEKLNEFMNNFLFEFGDLDACRQDLLQWAIFGYRHFQMKHTNWG